MVIKMVEVAKNENEGDVNIEGQVKPLGPPGGVCRS
jgi:hypothetical protein